MHVLKPILGFYLICLVLSFIAADVCQRIGLFQPFNSRFHDFSFISSDFNIPAYSIIFSVSLFRLFFYLFLHIHLQLENFLLFFKYKSLHTFMAERSANGSLLYISFYAGVATHSPPPPPDAIGAMTFQNNKHESDL